MSQQSNTLTKNRFLSALVMTALTVVLLFGVHTLTTVSGPKDPTTPIAIAPTDSSYCIACHTDADVIDSMALVVEKSDEPAAEGG